jgi:hypothetical protein
MCDATQIRIFDAKRLHDKIGKISPQQFENLRKSIKDIF